MPKSDLRWLSYGHLKVGDRAAMDPFWVGAWPMAILDPFFEISSSNLFCPSFLSRMMGKPKFSTIGLKMAHLAHKTPILAHFGHYLKMRFSQNINFIGWHQIYSLKDSDMRFFACCRESLRATNVGTEF